MKTALVCLFISCLSIVFSGCRKTPVTADPVYKMLGFSDSTHKYACKYENDRISAIYFTDTIGKITGKAVLRNTYSYQPNYVKAVFNNNTSQTYVEYFLNDSSLPIKILVHNTIGGKDSLVKQKFFFYHGDSKTQLDSILYTKANERTYRIIPAYVNGNLLECYTYQGTYRPAYIRYCRFTYFSTTNLMRSPNQLLYIYNDPELVEENFYLCNLFSAKALDVFGVMGFISLGNDSYASTAGSNGYSNISTNSRKQITTEQYAGTFPYLRYYIYE
jgi:hypothetical protein